MRSVTATLLLLFAFLVPQPAQAATVAAPAVLRQGTYTSPAPITVLGDSISFGNGNTAPKFNTSWPGQLRYQLSTLGYGNAGTGFVNANPDVLANPSYDVRWRFGPGVYPIAQGLHQRGVYGVPAGSWVSFRCTASCVTETAYLLPSTGAAYAQVDGGAWRRIRSQVNGTTSLPATPGLNPAHLVTTVPVGTMNTHTLTVWASGGTVKLWGVEARTGLGRVTVTNAAVSGRALLSLGVRGDFNDEAGGTTGLPIIDTLQKPRPGVVVIACGVNDWQSGRSTATIAGWLGILIARVRADGGTPVLYLPPQPSPALRNPAGPSYTDYARTYQSVADTKGVLFINHQRLYDPADTDEGKIWSHGQALGVYVDALHPNDVGSARIVGGYGTTPGIRSRLGL